MVRAGIFPPIEWLHDPNIKDNFGNTVADFLMSKDLPVPNEWYDESMINKKRNPDFI